MNIENRHGHSGMTDVILRTDDMKGLHGIVLCRYSLGDGDGCEIEWPIRVIGGGLDWAQGRTDRGMTASLLSRLLDEIGRIVENTDSREYAGMAWKYREHITDMVGMWKADNIPGYGD